MGSLSIQKGKRAEREVVRMLNPIIERVCQRLGVDICRLSRNLKQVQQGGFDLDGLPWIAIEVKHHQMVCLGQWWEQTKRQATNGRVPVLIWKKHGGKWNVRMECWLNVARDERVPAVADIAIEPFLFWFERRIGREIMAQGIPSERTEAVGNSETVQGACTSNENAVKDAHSKPWERQG